MDQKKTGAFIAQMRKEKGFTQAELADALLISDKTVSKWETGKGLPEVSLMLPLCETLGISVNELLTGAKLSPAEYQKNAEVNIMNLIQEREENKRKLVLEVIIIFITLLAACTLTMVAGLAELPTEWRIALIVIAIIVMVGGIAVAAVLEMSSGAFECSKCGYRFQPTTGAYLMAMHTITRRHLKCPKCGVRNWCKRTLTLETTDESEQKQDDKQA